MDIHVPAMGSRQRYPLLVMVHGGGFIAGSRQEMRKDWIDHFVHRGYVVANVSYRLGYINTTTQYHCNFIEGYPCLFAADSAEWYRAWYRAVQDIKGAIRYLVNRADIYQIDPNRIFLLGESAGGFIVLGAAFMDVPEEKPVFAGEMPALPTPRQPNLNNCPHWRDEVFPDSIITRPDLGDIEGEVERFGRPYTIRGVANIYGGMFTDLIERTPPGKHKPVVYQFHRACDLMVPFTRDRVYWGLSWCLLGCWNCYGIDKTPMAHGSRAISDWNQSKGYGLVFRNDFATVPFPLNCLFFAHSCLDQLSNPCHSSVGMDISRVEGFFRQQSFAAQQERAAEGRPEAMSVAAGPNPFSEVLYLQNAGPKVVHYGIVNAHGAVVSEGRMSAGEQYPFPTQDWPAGIYFLRMQEAESGQSQTVKLLKKP